MNLHEFQAKQLLQEEGVPVPIGFVISEAKQAEAAATTLLQKTGAQALVVKAQIHAGGRGKGTLIESPNVHGVAVVKDAKAAANYAASLLGKTLKTHQTHATGQMVRQVWIESAAAIASEMYVGLVLDRELSRISFLVSQQGGMDIEEVAAKSPQALFRLSIDPVTGFLPFHGRLLAKALALTGPLAKNAGVIFGKLYQLFCRLDMSLLEINPWVRTQDGQLLALDAKVNFDDNALFRHPDIAKLRDLHEEDIKESQAKDAGLSYVALDGEIGCLVNGAGLAMATMDIIKHCGSFPANFLDVGGGATAEQVSTAFQIILADKHVKAILVNIFGGIAKCDVIAEGIVTAAKQVSLQVPLVVRLEGTRVAEGKALLEKSGLTIVAADNMLDAAQKVVSAAKKGHA